jgi:hypothetical protein
VSRHTGRNRSLNSFAAYTVDPFWSGLFSRMPPDIFDLLDQGHFEEVLYLAGAPKTVALVKSHRSLQGARLYPE